MIAFLAILGVLVLVVWVIRSWCNTVNPDQVAFRQYFGKLSEDNMLEPGLHFVPWFWGIKLRKLPTDQVIVTYKMDPEATTGSVMSGNMLGVRSGDKFPQKLFVEATVFWRPPYKSAALMAKLIKAGVPVHNKEELEHWFRNATAPDMNYVFGKVTYLKAVGAQLNHEINQAVNRRLRGQHDVLELNLFNLDTSPVPSNPDSLLERSGLIGTTINPGDGEGEFNLEIENVHVQGPLGLALEKVETSKLEAKAQKGVAFIRIKTAEHEAEAQRVAAVIGVETAKSIAKAKAEVISGTIEIMFQQWFDGEVKRLGLDLLPKNTDDEKKAYVVAMTAFKESPGYKRKEIELEELRKAEMGVYTQNEETLDINVHSAGKPFEGSGGGATGLIALAGAFTTAVVKAIKEEHEEKEGDGGSGGGGNGGNPQGGGGKSTETPEQMFARLGRKYGKGNQ